MNDEQLDKILKKALTPQREIKEEEIVLKKRRKEEKMMRKKRMKMAGIAGTVAAALALACIVPQTSFAEQLKKMFQGYWGQRSELSDYVTRGVFSDQDEHMIFSVEEILSDEVVWNNALCIYSWRKLPCGCNAAHGSCTYRLSISADQTKCGFCDRPVCAGERGSIWRTDFKYMV